MSSSAAIDVSLAGLELEYLQVEMSLTILTSGLYEIT